MEIIVFFSGFLSWVAGTSCKHYSNISSFDDLRHRIEDDYPGLMNYNFRYAVNNEEISGEPSITTGDEVLCLPLFPGD